MRELMLILVNGLIAGSIYALIALGFALYQLVGGNVTEEVIEACVAIELFNISTYQSNIAFDRKAGAIDTRARNSQFICSMLTLGAAERLLTVSAEKLNSTATSDLLMLLRKTNDDIYRGQFYDLHLLASTILDNGITYEDYLKTYRLRCRLLGGRLISFCLQAGAILGGAEDPIIRNLDKLGEEIGTAGQMLNDLANLLPRRLVNSDLDGYQPSYSDLRNHKITYPLFDLWIHAKEHAEFVRELLKRGDITDKDEEKLFDLLCEAGSIHRIRQVIARTYYDLKKRLRSLPTCHARKMLGIALSGLLTNKFFAAIRHDKNIDYRVTPS